MKDVLPAALRILDALADPAIVMAADRRLAGINREAEQLLGCTAVEARGRPVDELLAVLEPAGWPGVAARLAAQGCWQGQVRAAAGREESRRVRLTSRPLDPALGLPADHALLVVGEAPEFQTAPKTLSNTEAALLELVQRTHLMMTLLDEHGGVTDFNPAAERLTGIPRAEAVGVRFWDLMLRFLPPEKRTEEHRRRLESSIAAGLRENKALFRAQEEFEYVHRDGTRRFAEQIAFVPLVTSQGPRFVSAALDVTDRRLAELALRESEEKFRAIAENLPGVVFLCDLEGRIVYASPSIEQVYGYSPSQLTGRHFADLLPEERREIASLRFKTLLSGQEPLRQIPLTPMRADGSTFAGELSTSRWSVGGQVRGTLGFTQDVSERAEAIEQRQKLENQLLQAMKMEAVGRLAGGVAHDFNNYLTSIVGNVELALLDLPEGPIQELLVEVNQAADRAADLTRQLLAFSRKQIIEPRVVDLNQLISNLGRMLARLIGEDIDLRVVTTRDGCRVKVDPGQFEQILVNLAVNARDAMPDGGLLVIETARVALDAGYCRKHVGANPGEFVRLSVSDTGMGLSPEAKAHLFEPFFTTKEHGKGTGLGLATTYGAVQQAGGRIEVYSEPGRGTSFKLYLPCAEGAVTELTRKQSTALTGGDETILLVEDEPLVRETTARLLKKLGYRVVSACDGQEAMQLAAQHDGKIDLLLTDVVMPGMNGRTLSQRLLEVRPEVRVLFASGYTENVIVIHGVLEDGINFIGKPYSPAALATKVRAILDGEVPEPPAKR